MNGRPSKVAWVSLAACALLQAACGNEPAGVGAPSTAASPFAAAVPPQSQRASENPRGAVEAPAMPLTDSSFVEGRNTRDPFRVPDGVIPDVVARCPEGSTLPGVSLDDMRLVAVVAGSGSPYAMVVDPTRNGTTLRRGMYVGRSEVVRAAQGGGDYVTCWRVSRINPARLRRDERGRLQEVPAEVVFERPNPFEANAPVAERSLSLGAQTPAG